jgi:hypothetical protein
VSGRGRDALASEQAALMSKMMFGFHVDRPAMKMQSSRPHFAWFTAAGVLPFGKMRMM